ncbi:MAG TPA: hypothetical protein VGA08_00930 [Candidatus Saccharimonadales bacterium]
MATLRNYGYLGFFVGVLLAVGLLFKCALTSNSFIHLLIIILFLLIWSFVTYLIVEYIRVIAINSKRSDHLIEVAKERVSITAFYSEIKKPVTRIMGIVEIAITTIVTYVVWYGDFSASVDEFEKLKIFGGYIIGWFAAKTIAVPQDSKEKEGLSNTETRYKFMLGTLVNYIGGILLAYIINKYL